MTERIAGAETRRQKVRPRARPLDERAPPEDEQIAARIEALRRAGAPADFIYAARKTRRIVTWESRRLLQSDELAAWDAAVEEYHQQQRERRGLRR